MSIEYEFQINKTFDKNKKSTKSLLKKLNKFCKKKIVIKSSQIQNDYQKDIYKCFSTRDLDKIIQIISKISNTKLIYIIKKDDRNDILDVMYDYDINYYNSDITNEKENIILANIYNNKNIQHVI